MQLTPVIALHLSAATAAVLLGPVVVWARRPGAPRPGFHRASGYVWVALMVSTALTALFIRDFDRPNINGYTPIHLFVPFSLGLLVLAFRCLRQGKVDGHRKTMLRLYFGACVTAGLFSLMPNRLLGRWLWGGLGLL